MSLSRRLSLVVISVFVAAGCATGCATAVSTDDGPDDDAGIDLGDTGAHDAKAADAGLHGDAAGHGDTGGGTDQDGSTNEDAETIDAADATSAEDASIGDTSIPDTSVADTSVPDTSIPDTSTPDTSIADTSIPDTSIPDTSIPDTSVPDTSVPPVDAGTCNPPTTGFSPVYHAPRARQVSACTTTQISNFYDKCIGPNATTALCTTWQSSLTNATCDSCLTVASSPTSTTWGPFLQYPQYIVNDQGACIALDKGTSQSACAHDLEYQTECEHFSCDTGCANATETEYDACLTAADGGGGICASYVAASQTDCTVASVCFGGTDFASNFKQVVAVFCQ